MNNNNPYRTGTRKFDIFEVLSDLDWHCSECELPGSQPAKALQMMRQDGFELEKVGSNWEKRIYCESCKRVTPHRRLISTTPVREAITRTGFSQMLAARIRKSFNYADAYLGYQPTGRTIEIDHRIPQIRWGSSEALIAEDMAESEIKERFMLLTREHNLLKSRNCEKCVREQIRPPFFEINFYFAGNEEYSQEIACKGCGWAFPEKWRMKLNELININLLPLEVQ